MSRLRIVILGLTVTSSWGNGHATNYRALTKAMAGRGHDVLFLERDKPWYAQNRDLPDPPHGRTVLYDSLDELREEHRDAVREADLVIVGSYVPEGVAVCRWAQQSARGVVMFYDIDTPVTLAKLAREDFEYLSPEVVPGFDAYLSFTGGPTLDRLQREFAARRPTAFYCLVDPDLYHPEDVDRDLELGYLGTYSDDRQPTVQRLLIEPARRLGNGRFSVAGPGYPPEIDWPANVERIDHLPPAEHRRYYNRQRFTLNVTRRDMIEAGWSPSVRLFEAAACGTPIISDIWEGIDAIFQPGRDILLARDAEEVVRALRETDEDARLAMGERARRRVLAEHTAEHRVEQLEALLQEAGSARHRRMAVGT